MTIDWYFDFISPFAYLQWQRVRTLHGHLPIEFRPILFAGILDHLQHKGPAEFPVKRDFTYRHVIWRAQRAGIALKFPPAHPFNPLAPLRLCVAAGSSAEAIDAIFNHLWRDGLRGDDAVSLAPVARALGIDDLDAALRSAAVKAQLKANFDAALAQQVFGVPTFAVDGTLFWGEDATQMFEDFVHTPAMFETDEMRRVSELPVGIARRV